MSINPQPSCQRICAHLARFSIRHDDIPIFLVHAGYSLNFSNSLGTKACVVDYDVDAWKLKCARHFVGMLLRATRSRPYWVHLKPHCSTSTSLPCSNRTLVPSGQTKGSHALLVRHRFQLHAQFHKGVLTSAWKRCSKSKGALY